jgi:hypothetical protein
MGSLSEASRDHKTNEGQKLPLEIKKSKTFAEINKKQIINLKTMKQIDEYEM